MKSSSSASSGLGARPTSGSMVDTYPAATSPPPSSLYRKKASNVIHHRLSMDDSYAPVVEPTEFAVDNPILSPLSSPPLAPASAPSISLPVNDDIPMEPVLVPTMSTPMFKKVSQAQLRPGNSPLHKPSSEYEKRQSLSAYMKTNSFIEKQRLALSKKSNAGMGGEPNGADFFGSFSLDSEDEDNVSDFSDFYDVARPMTGTSTTSMSRSRMSSSIISESFDVTEEQIYQKGVRTYYLHIRVFLPDSHSALALSAVVWGDNGDRLGYRRIDLRNIHPDEAPTPSEGAAPKETSPYHYVGEVQLDAPLRVGYFQIRRLQRKQLTLKRGYAVDVFIKDVFLKSTKDTSPEKDILAFARFQAYMHGRDVILRNLLSESITPQALGVIRAHDVNRRHVLQDKMLPEMEWAKADGKPKSKGILLTTAEKLQQVEQVVIEWPNTSQHEKPAMFNYTLRVAFDPTSYNGMPGYVDLPNKSVSFSWTKFSEFYEDVQAVDALECAKRMSNGGKSMCYIDFTAFLEQRSAHQHYGREIMDMKRIVKYFDTDEEMGRQYLEGLFVAQLQQYHSQEETLSKNLARHSLLPNNGNGGTMGTASKAFVNMIRQEFKPSSQWVCDLANEAGADMNKPVFFADYSLLVGVPRNRQQGAYYAPARVVFQVDSTSGKMLPIGISLYYEEEEQWKSHLPKMASWKVAKLFVKCAAGQEHQAVNHALHTHLCVEPFAIALERKVPLHHILYRILKPHFRYTLDLNFKAKTLLLNENGRFDYVSAIAGVAGGHLQLMLSHFKEWSFAKMCLPEDLKRRGFDIDPSDPDFPLPSYLYAKDAMAIWKIIESYVSSVIFECYQTDEQLEQDEVVTNYFYEVHREGFPGNSSFYPSTREELVRVITGVISSATVQHGSVNFPQFVQYAFVANSPLMLIKPAPQPHEQGSVDQFLPNEQQALKAMRTTWGLSRFSMNDERYMWSEDRHFFNLGLWNDKRFRPYCEKFQQRAENLERHILRREESAYGTRYLWMLPSTMPTSITT
ncbi:hypothetical protein BASA81_001739 [Batrachochytrium salamandrivorans]|nr:hypothetical protein BASA81_001739 [Batrachochytrium salamandrivorans]